MHKVRLCVSCGERLGQGDRFELGAAGLSGLTVRIVVHRFITDHWPSQQQKRGFPTLAAFPKLLTKG